MVDRYVDISQDDFEKAIEKFSPKLVKPKGVFEAVYKLPLPNDLSIWIYSTIDIHSGVSREKGSDAIKAALMYQDTRIIKVTSKTPRVEKWSDNLREKIEELKALVTEYRDPQGHPLLKKKKKDGKGIFYGCALYPECKYIYKGERPLSKLHEKIP
ncbi:MAG: hypothetical protein P1Q69_13260 [Candidatus Thorarchaeota archaeon]|nr:hypothetical protein [Candidatus Thorarchaeota archaeon]